MLRLRFPIETDANPRGDQPHSQLDILDRGVLVTNVETAEALKQLPADGPAAGPERGRAGPADAMRVTVQKIAITGEKSRVGGIFIVSPENRAHRRIGKMRGQPAQRFRMHAHVRVKKNNDVAGRLRRS